MKALYCRYCGFIGGLKGDRSIVECWCRPTTPPQKDRGRCRARWADPQRGLALYCEVAQGGAERDEQLRDEVRYHERGTAISRPRALYGLGIHNALLTRPDHARLDHVACAEASAGSRFAAERSLIVRFRPGETSDTAYVTLDELEDGGWPGQRLALVPRARAYG